VRADFFPRKDAKKEKNAKKEPGEKANRLGIPLESFCPLCALGISLAALRETLPLFRKGTTMEIAFVGMGLMGAPMAANCLKAGHAVTVTNRTAAKCEPLRETGAAVAATPAEAARGKEAVLICVEDTPDVEAVLFGPDGIAEGLKDRGRGESRTGPPIVIDHSTISAEATAGFARRLKEATGALFLDAPVSGGDVGAKAGTLSIMCGGPAEAFDRARPLLEAMGKTITHVGPNNGDGQRCKMINQLVVAINCVATTEAMRLCETLGLDAATVLSAISQGAAGSWSLSNLGPKTTARDWAPGFRLRHLLKDLGFCAEAIAGKSLQPQTDFPGLALAHRLVKHGVTAGHGEENIHALARAFMR
jgi:3-hydroxyisobutyrate dehydrogenase